MDASDFRVVEHVIPCSYIRDYPNATRGQRDDAELQLAIKQYLPKIPVSENDLSAVTIIATHSTSLPKEALEPLWEELHACIKPAGTKIRSIWIADMVNHGASGILNEHILGDDYGWYDQSRDLMHMINIFRKELPRPIVGIGHSMGAQALVNLSLMHPRLLAGLILIEPMISAEGPPGPNFAAASTKRKDLWLTRTEGEQAIRKSWKRFDPRVVDRLLKYSLRNVPTAIYPVSDKVPKGAVTLTTTKHQEVWTYVRSNFTASSLTDSGTVSWQDRLLAPEMDPMGMGQDLFTRSELPYTFSRLPHLRPRVFWLFGGRSPMSTTELAAAKVNATGTGLGGMGGVNSGQVQWQSFRDCGHFMPYEQVKDTAEVSGAWLVEMLEKWRADEEFLRNHDPQKSDKDMLRVSATWTELTKYPAGTKRDQIFAGKSKL